MQPTAVLVEEEICYVHEKLTNLIIQDDIPIQTDVSDETKEVFLSRVARNMEEEMLTCTEEVENKYIDKKPLFTQNDATNFFKARLISGSCSTLPCFTEDENTLYSNDDKLDDIYDDLHALIPQTQESSNVDKSIVKEEEEENIYSWKALLASTFTETEHNDGNLEIMMTDFIEANQQAYEHAKRKKQFSDPEYLKKFAEGVGVTFGPLSISAANVTTLLHSLSETEQSETDKYVCDID